ncbi:MAG: hypothetical protein H0U74_17105 [Bradymonadaceae bacterium]|nr:hypothetical protein [Lujinxingiaceae bacterium]
MRATFHLILLVLGLTISLSALGLVACSDETAGTATNNAANNTTTNNATNNADSDVVVVPDVAVFPGFEGCDPLGPQCNNCKDDDGDGLIDGFDPHCISPYDDNESSFATGIPGDNVSNSGFQDCFFDGNSGSGNDGCRIPNGCILGTQTTGCEQTQRCIDSCKPMTRQGCDCFGCCTICNKTMCKTVVVNAQLAPNCTLEALDDPAKCPPCTLNEGCSTPCDPEQCALCPGQLPSDLPESCGGEASCPSHMAPCATTADCEGNAYCSLGCCMPIYL